MNIIPYNTKDYENKHNWTLGQNKPNSNPIKPNFQKAQMNVNLTLTKDYRKKDDFAVRKNKPNSKPISVKAKMNVNAFSQKDYENVTAFRPQKNKPNQTQFQMPTNPSKERKEKKGYQELFLSLCCRKGYNIVLSKRKYPLVSECRSRGYRLAFVYLLPPRVYFGG